MKITLIVGPMFSGKTTELLRLVDRKRITGKKCLIIKRDIDNRYSTTCIVTHSKIKYEQCDIIHLVTLTSEFITDIIKDKKYDVVAIEEGHFFPELSTYCNILANNDIEVIVSALDSDFKQQPFIGIDYLMAKAETIKKLHAICMHCKINNASFTIRIVNSEQQILVGGTESYHSVCRKCLNIFKKTQNKKEMIEI